MSILVDARRATELTLLDQIDKFIGWLERRDRTRLAQVVTVLRKCFGDEVKLEARMYEALTDLQTYVAKVRSGPIRKLLKTPVAALCRSRDVPVIWEVNPRPRRGKWKGVVIGAVIGAGGAIAATEGKDINLPAGTIVRIRLDSPATIR